MKLKGIAAALLAVVLMVVLCAREPEEKVETVLYFPVSGTASYGSALGTQSWEGGTDPEELIEALLAGPDGEELRNPFPKGVTLQKLEREGGVIRLTLSESYGGLTDISQTLADACIVLTLGQLDGVEAVEIHTGGFWVTRPASRTLRPEEIETDSLLVGRTNDLP